MSLFKRKAPSSVEIARENDRKQFITAELSAAVKKLQQEQQLNPGEPIRSSDSANAVCSILESIFLHGCKKRVSKMIANYIGLNPGHENEAEETNFWLFCERFTHSDVVSQLKRLAQITSEIGLCRAWIRVALNDGLMESYVNAMIADKRSLEYFYSSTSYFRDPEQPGIFLSFLKGLMSYECQLSFNSSVLNSWPHSSLVLAGVIDTDNTPLPVVHPPRATPRAAEGEQRDEDMESPNPATKQRVRGKKRISLEDRGLSPLPQGRPVSEYSSELTPEDVDQIRGIKPRNKTRSECSTSSQMSCPDPVKYNKNPASYVTDQENDNDPMFDIGDEILSQVCQNCNSESVERHYDADDINQKSPNAISSMDSGVSSPSNPTVMDPGLYAEMSFSLSVELMNSKDSESSVLPVGSIGEPKKADKCDCVEESNNTSSKKAVPVYITENGASIAQRSPQEQQFVNERILQDILNTELSSPKSNTSDSSLNSKNGSPDIRARRKRSRRKDLMPDIKIRSSPLVPAQASPARVDFIETSRRRIAVQHVEKRNDDIAILPGRARSGAMSVCIEIEPEPESKPEPEGDDGDMAISSPPSTGNSLGAHGGWSSDFDQPQLTADNQPARDKSESFSALLRNYTPSSYVVSPTMEEILKELSDHDCVPSPQQVDPAVSTPQEDDYEIVGDLDSGSSDRNSTRQTELLGVIATEKGLDAQNSKCESCNRPIGFIYGKHRVCTFDGEYYCFECHENDRYYIPALILHNWDFRKHIVSKKSLAFLQDVEDHSVINISDVNPKLYEHIKEMGQLQVLRKQLCHLKTYLFTCKQSIADEFRKSMWPKEYLYEGIDTYTLADLLQVPSGQFAQYLKKSIKFATKHVYGCHLCSSKGFICELCNNPKVIYPFQTDDTVRCLQCKSVFHKACKSENVSCPKCDRRNRRTSENGETLETPDIHDYAFIPEFSD